MDTLLAVETPEGIELVLRPAGPLPRLLAWLFDLLIRTSALILISAGVGNLGRFGWGLILIFAFLLEWFYPVLFEVYRAGQTPGKRLFGLRVLCDDGTPVNWPASLIRNLLRVVDFLPLLYGVGLVSMIISRDFRRLGDIGAGTLVVYADKPGNAPELDTRTPQAPPFKLTLEEQQAVVSFAERLGDISRERAEELARLARPLGQPGKTVSPERLEAIASWLVGRP